MTQMALMGRRGFNAGQVGFTEILTFIKLGPYR
jgi:hypothetical protein